MTRWPTSFDATAVVYLPCLYPTTLQQQQQWCSEQKSPPTRNASPLLKQGHPCPLLHRLSMLLLQLQVLLLRWQEQQQQQQQQ